MRLGSWFHELRQDALIALRQLRRSPGFAIVATVTLALGIGATTAVFAVVDAVMLRPLPFREPEQLVVITRERPGGGATVEMTYPEFRDLRDGSKSFSALAALPSAIQSAAWTDGTSSEPLGAVAASGNLFDLLGARALLGRTLTVDDDRKGAAPALLLGHGVWTRAFGGSRDVVGRRVELSGTPYTVVGVMPKGFEYPRGAEAWVALVPSIDTLVDNKQIAFLKAVGRVQAGVSQEAARREAERLLGESATAAGIPSKMVLAPNLTPIENELLGDARRGLLVLLAAAALVLLVACANVANLLLARAATREGELAVRTALGANRARLVRQLLAESMVVGGVGTALGLVGCVVARGPIAALVPADLYRADVVEIDVRVAAFTALLMGVTTVVFGIIPALRGTRLSPGAVLRAAAGRTTAAGSARRAQRSLIALEVALAVVLLIGGGVLVRSFARLSSAPLGFDRSHTLSAEIFLPDAKYSDPATIRTFFKDAIARVRQLPGVTGAGAVLLRPLAGPDGFDYPVSTEGMDAATQRNQPLVNYEAVTPGYLQAAGIPIMQGRDVADADDERAPRVVIVSAAMARRFWPNESPVGKRLKWGPPESPAPWIEVIGIAGAARYRDPRVESLDVYVPYTQSPWKLNHMIVRTAGAPNLLASAVRSAVSSVDPDARAVSIATVNELASAALRQPRFQMTLVGAFATLALLLGAVGIFGVVSFATARRARELAVRIALGAKGGDVQRLVIAETLRTVGVGIVVGVVAALAGTRVIRSLVYDVSAADPLTFVLVPLAVIVVAVLAAAIPARRASRVDPISVLRME
jgi:predicted permease